MRRAEPNLVARCPAKVNLSLRVLGRRADGFHELDTVFQAIDLWDVLEVRSSDSLSLACNHPGLELDERNLVLRAARLLRTRHAGGGPGAAFTLQKVIPVQGGLGGGSSDAAASLLLCDRFWSLGLSHGRLQELGAELGSDVPFFLTGGTARGRGRGERIEPLRAFGPTPVVLGCPPFGVPTKTVFEMLPGRLTLPGNGVSVFPASAHKWPEDNDFGFFSNDLESVVFGEWPELRQFRDALLEVGAAAALLSGSGSAVFGVFPGGGRPVVEAKRLVARFPGWRVLTTRFIEEGIRLRAPGERGVEPNRGA